MSRSVPPLAVAVLAASIAGPGLADGLHAIDREDAVFSDEASGVVAAFDILAAHAHRMGDTVTFRMTTAGVAGAETPEPAGSLGGAPVLSYVWPTSLDPAAVGFEGGTGILALAATSHPDFDDTPLYDEDRDGDPANDGAEWHGHWVVLTPTEGCSEGALGVRDIPEGETPAMPETWPGLPIFLDSPDVTPVFDGPEVTLTVRMGEAVPEEVSYDGVTAALRVNADVHAPLLCVTDVLDVASGDLSLPGRLR